VSVADLHAVGHGRRAAGEQRELFFRARGSNYWAIAWVGKDASKSDRDDLSGLIGSIQFVK
jgi:hypothetical protein